MSRVRRAYELTPYQADDLIQELYPHAVFPLGLWQRAYEHFWKDYARTAAMRQRAECLILPDVEMEPGKRFFTDLCGFDVMAFFRKLSLLINSKITKMGLDYILSETYGTFDNVCIQKTGTFSSARYRSWNSVSQTIICLMLKT